MQFSAAEEEVAEEEAAWLSGQGAGLEIWRSRVQVLALTTSWMLLSALSTKARVRSELKPRGTWGEGASLQFPWRSIRSLQSCRA